MSEELKFTLVSPTLKKKLVAAYGHTIRISRNDYKLIWCSDLIWKERPIMGLCDTHNHVLHIVTDSIHCVDTLVHEIAHAEFAASGLRQTRFWTSDLEEQVVELMSQMIAATFQLKKRG